MFDTHLFAEKLREARIKRGLSQTQLAASLCVSTQAVSKWEQGKSLPDLSRLQELAELLRVSADDLLCVGPAGSDALIAVDGGGTKTEFVLITPQGDLLRRLVLEGSNPNICTVSGACEILRRGIDTLLQEGNRVLGIYVGGAGMGSAGNGKAVEKVLRSAYPNVPVRCETDIFNVLACAGDADNAIAVISGTGSVVYATQDGVLHRFGGGGWKLDPLGSGYGLGVMALTAALEHRDGTGPATVLTDAVEQQLGSSVWEGIGKIYDAPPAYAASFAPLVLAAWQQGDAVAAEIIEQNCARLAHLIAAAARRSPKATQVLLGGGLFKNEAYYKKVTSMLPQHFTAAMPQYPQIWGACLRCAKLAGLDAPQTEKFMKQYLQEE